MSFDTPLYVLFLAGTVLLYRFFPKRFRWILLLIASLVFYACWSPPLTLVILAVIAIAYLSGRMIEKGSNRSTKKGWLVFAAASCIGLLFWFKYLNFLLSEISLLFQLNWTKLNILLPVGCSFYTFQALAYVIDVYRGKIHAVPHFGRFALFICFFPQLVAGPIERARDLIPQIEEMPDPKPEDRLEGVKLLLSGFFRKNVIADMASPAVNRVFAESLPDGSAVLIALLLFSFQIYCDFAGYSEIAQGSARMMGIRLRRNFDRPYLSRTVRSFWRRWHISLSDWFTDYVYIPLGGNRMGIRRQVFSMLVVFCLSGLWHGANWTFIAWGLWHGILCAFETVAGRKEQPVNRWQVKDYLQWLVTGTLILLSWLLFRASSIQQAFLFLKALFSSWHIQEGWNILGWNPFQAICMFLALCQLPFLKRLSHAQTVSKATALILAACIVIAWVIKTSSGEANAFIYFQF